ncbi:MAG: DNA-binding response regulator [Bdellovibrionales bacterium CG10_big_fil_rev_8_21_14_0_10_45_34]|nr:MAG: DNA-binding response regulator [Bdellovibrionales bacterium CG10_big_fil_rev_8_21_14_0_10_45_34]
MRGQVLVIDDESSIRISITRFLESRSFQVFSAGSLLVARELLSKNSEIDVVLLDLRLPDGNGIEFLTEIRSQNPQTQVVVLSGFGTVQNAIEATQRGAFHFITKPFNLEEVAVVIDRAIEQKKLKTENTALKQHISHRYKFSNIIGESKEIKSVLSLIERVCDTDATVLVTGESGTGKELVAQAIHQNSSRRNELLIPVNCGAIPAELLESELFGHIKGAFTGATQNRVGRFELADNGTLFLDEIGELSPSLQVKLLRVLQNQRFEPLGSTKSVEVNVRIIAATNRNLEDMIERGTFREDLYYRLNVIPIHIPALRERRADIAILLEHFRDFFNRTKGRMVGSYSREVTDVLSQYAWPGNVRELENLVERLSILKGSGAITLEDLPPKYRANKAMLPAIGVVEFPFSGIDFNHLVDKFENDLILEALKRTDGNRNQAAMLLGLNRTTLVEKIKKKGLQVFGKEKSQPAKDPRSLITENADSALNSSFEGVPPLASRIYSTSM